MKVFVTLLAMLLATGMNNVAIADTDPPLVTVDDDKNPDEGSPISKNKAVIGAVIVGAVVIAALGGRALAKRMKGSTKKIAGASDQKAPNHRASTEGGNGSKGNTDTVAGADPDVEPQVAEKPQDVEPQVANKPETTEVDDPKVTEEVAGSSEVTEEATNTNTVKVDDPKVTDSSEVTKDPKTTKVDNPVAKASAKKEKLVQAHMAKGLEAHPETIKALEDVGKLADLSAEDAKKLDDFWDEYDKADEYGYKDGSYIRAIVHGEQTLDLTELVDAVSELHARLLKNPSDMGLQIDFYKKEDLLRRLVTHKSTLRKLNQGGIGYDAYDYMDKIYMDSPIVRVVQVRMDVIFATKKPSTFENLDAYEKHIDRKVREMLLEQLSDIKAQEEIYGPGEALMYTVRTETGHIEELVAAEKALRLSGFLRPETFKTP